MIFVTTGTCEPFDRLLEAVDGLDTDERIVAQCGESHVRPRRAECVDFLTFDELRQLVGEARVVVTHGGVGSILVAIKAGVRPVVVPRSRRFGDAVDDHQIGFSRRLHAAGRITLVESADDLRSALASLVDDERIRDGDAIAMGTGLVAELREYLASTVEPTVQAQAT
jgi:UDP-N-acetylglucosamine transferase subunit ALG13